ncbi:hypothetical protein HK102_008279, partial [Quaeritorhiza haematococci]
MPIWFDIPRPTTHRLARERDDPERPPTQPAPQAEPENDQQDAGGDGVGPDQPNDGQRPGGGIDQKDHAEGDRQEPADDQQPFAADFLSKPDGRDDLEEPRDDRPGRDHAQQRDRRDPGPQEGHESRRDAYDALQQHGPPGQALGAAGQNGDEGEDAVRQAVGAKEDYQGPQRDPRPGEGQDPEEHGEQPPQCQGPPVASQRVHDHPPLLQPGFGRQERPPRATIARGTERFRSAATPSAASPGVS